MTRRTINGLFVGLEWETLLGLDKEARELRDLCKRRNADLYVIVADDFGLRTAGLMREPSKARRDENAASMMPQADKLFSLAAILTGRNEHRAAVFIHTVPDDTESALLIGVKGGRPEIDRILPISEAQKEAALFIESMENDIQIWGNVPLEGCVVTPFTLPTVATVSDTERDRCALRSPHPTRTLSPRLVRRLVAIGLGTTVCVCLALLVKALWPTPALVPVKAPDHLARYQQQIQRTLSEALDGTTSNAAKQIEWTVSNLPLQVAAWRMTSMVCTPQSCIATWHRENGGTYDSLLRARPMAVLQQDDSEKALETIEIAPAKAPVSPLNLLKRETFTRLALSRAQYLRDHGLLVNLKPVAPLIPAPAELKSDMLASRTPGKGEWEMSGHLAFLDSVHGFMTRTGNMRLTSIEIATDPAQPEFIAGGTYYVE